MEPSIEEKNVAIAKMLGWEVKPWGGITQPYFKGKLWNGWCCGSSSIESVEKTLTIHVQYFHSDANWQFEAIKFIKTLKFNTIISWNFIAISDHRTQLVEKVIFLTYKEDPKEAIFEALYQFSQYLKKK